MPIDFVDSYFKAFGQGLQRKEMEQQAQQFAQSLQFRQQIQKQNIAEKQREFDELQAQRESTQKFQEWYRRSMDEQNKAKILSDFTSGGGFFMPKPQDQTVDLQPAPMRTPQIPMGLGENDIGAIEASGDTLAGGPGVGQPPIGADLPMRQAPQVPVQMGIPVAAQLPPLDAATPMPAFPGQDPEMLAFQKTPRQLAYEKAYEQTIGKTADDPVMSQELYDTLPAGVRSIIGAKPGEKYDSKIQEKLIESLVKDQETKLPDQWKGHLQLKIAENGGQMPDSKTYDKWVTEFRNASETDSSRTLKAINIVMNERKMNAEAALSKSYSGMIFNAPEIWKDATKDPVVKASVVEALAAQGYEPPRETGAKINDLDFYANRTRQFTLELQQALADPVAAKVVKDYMGPIMGRLSEAEQDAGIIASIKDPVAARIVQQFRTALRYMVFGEGQQLFGGRIPIQLMNELKSTSPSYEKAYNLFKGALNSVQRNAENTIIAANKYIWHDKLPPGFTERTGIKEQGSFQSKNMSAAEVGKIPPSIKSKLDAAKPNTPVSVVNNKTDEAVMITKDENGVYHMLSLD